MSRIAIIGAGAWGTALSIVLGREETHRIRLWAHETEVCESIAQRRINEKFLPGQLIPGCVTPCNDLAEALDPTLRSCCDSVHNATTTSGSW